MRRLSRPSSLGLQYLTEIAKVGEPMAGLERQDENSNTPVEGS